MRFRRALAVIGLTAMSAALLADPPMIRPGRWEVVMQLDFGDQKLPEGMPLAEPDKKIDCITPADLERFHGFLPPPDEGCEVSNYKATGKEISYLMQCDDVAVDFKATVHSPDSFSAVSTSHGEDPSEQMVMKFSARRVGEACSAQELAESQND